MRRALILAAFAFGMIAAACGDSGDATTTTTMVSPRNEPAFPVVVAGGNGDVTIGSRPERIVSTSSTATEMLYAIGAGPQVVAVDRFSNHPPEAPATDLDEFAPSVEAILSFEPDLVVVATDVDGIVAALDAVGSVVLLLPPATSLDDVYGQIEQLGAATGHGAEADALATDLRDDVAAIVAGLPELEEPLTYYHELDTTYFTATSETFIGEVYSLLGLVNIADGAGADQYVQLSPEEILERDPDLIFLADATCCGESAATVAARPGFDALTAVQSGAVVELDSDIVSRWGPRIVEFMRVAADAIAARAGAGA